jgi:L-lactate dehydrogenase
MKSLSSGGYRMGNGTRKVAIVGAGMVGSGCAYSMINQSICDEIMIIDRTYDKALAHALDLSHCMEFTTTRTKVSAGHLKDCSDRDVIILTAGSYPKSSLSRLELLADAKATTENIVKQIMNSGFNGIFVVVANPVDIITYYVREVSGLPRERVIGTGTSIDTSRMKTLVSEVFAIDPRSVQGYTLGEHGDSQFVAWSHVTVGGKPILQILQDHSERFKDVNLQRLEDNTKNSGWEILSRKGNTQFGISNALAYITRSILNDEHKIIAVSAILDGEYQQKDICIGVPAVIGKGGIQEIVELNLAADEKEKFLVSCGIIKENILKLFD